MDDILKEKAIEIAGFIEEHFIDSKGRVYTMLDKATKQPAADDFFADAGEPENIMDFTVLGFSRSDVAKYENCGMCTGAYLLSLVYRYQAEQDIGVLIKARRCYNALKFIFEQGKELETGFFPKPYDGCFSEETSSDQCLYAIFAMDKYYEFAFDEEQKEIDFMIPAIAEFWRKRNYKYDYWNQKNMQWPIMRFPVFMLLAYKHSGDKKFKNEYERLLSDWRESYPLQFNLLGNKQKGVVAPSEYEKKYNAWIVSSMPDYMTMRMMELEYLLNNDPDNYLAPRWKQSILDMWNQAKLTLAPSGKAYHMVFVDMKTGDVSRPGPCELRTSQTGWSTMIARATVQALAFYPGDDGMKNAAKEILGKLELEEMSYYDEPERLPVKERFKTRFLSGDSVTNWLWTYWQGRGLKLW